MCPSLIDHMGVNPSMAHREHLYEVKSKGGLVSTEKIHGKIQIGSILGVFASNVLIETIIVHKISLNIKSKPTQTDNISRKSAMFISILL